MGYAIRRSQPLAPPPGALGFAPSSISAFSAIQIGCAMPAQLSLRTSSAPCLRSPASPPPSSSMMREGSTSCFIRVFIAVPVRTHTVCCFSKSMSNESVESFGCRRNTRVSSWRASDAV